jgi:UDP-glucuronate 4-epimerase
MMTMSHRVSLYGATKRANELMAHGDGYRFNLSTAGLRFFFFTVHSPWRRLDVALFLSTRTILEGVPLTCMARVG